MMSLQKTFLSRLQIPWAKDKSKCIQFIHQMYNTHMQAHLTIHKVTCNIGCTTTHNVDTILWSFDMLIFESLLLTLSTHFSSFIVIYFATVVTHICLQHQKLFMDFKIISTIECIIENAEKRYMSIYIYYILKAQTMHIKLIILACQSVFLKMRQRNWEI